MPKAISIDLRERAVEAHRRGDGSYLEVAEQFGIGVASLNRWIRRLKERGGLEPSGHSGGRATKVSEEQFVALRALVKECPDRTVDEITREWCHRTNVTMSRSAMLRALHRAGLTLKKSPPARRSNSAKTSWRGV